MKLPWDREKSVQDTCFMLWLILVSFSKIIPILRKIEKEKFVKSIEIYSRNIAMTLEASESNK